MRENGIGINRGNPFLKKGVSPDPFLKKFQTENIFGKVFLSEEYLESEDSV